MTNPEQAVIDAINGLERDEIGDIVRWQLEEGMRRGDHLRYPQYRQCHDRLAYLEEVIRSADPWSLRSESVSPEPTDSPGSLWRTWDEDFNLVSESDERPTTWTEGHYVTVDRPYGYRQSWRVYGGRLVDDMQFLRATEVYSNPFLPPEFQFPLERGARIGWQDAGGRVHVGVVESHVENPRGSGQWEVTIGADRDSDPVAAVGSILSGLLDIAESLTDDSEADQ
ncbi:hypothetical protein ACIBG0_38890 [Nocardia sp. NPDC050630]|uniref:hypothetical protein n=1 Tax=Nocardia sp. NPDC050630 TaxID=3364321 RepID=UPI0037B6AE8E